jgi:hypothetical protein
MAQSSCFNNDRVGQSERVPRPRQYPRAHNGCAVAGTPPVLKRKRICRAALVAVSATFLSTVVSADVVRRHSVPSAYQGRWLAANGSVIELTARTYVSREANCSVDWVSKIGGARGSIYSVRLRCSNPAGKRVSSNLIIRPKDINEIATGPAFEKLVNFRRCATGECQMEGD